MPITSMKTTNRLPNKRCRRSPLRDNTVIQPVMMLSAPPPMCTKRMASAVSRTSAGVSALRWRITRELLLSFRLGSDRRGAATQEHGGGEEGGGGEKADREL